MKPLERKFSFHSTAIENTAYPAAKGGLKLAQGNVTVHVSVTDADYDVSAFGQDSIADTTVVLKIERGSSETNRRHIRKQCKSNILKHHHHLVCSSMTQP